MAADETRESMRSDERVDLCVVSHRPWVAADFETGVRARPGVRVHRSLGLDIPVIDSTHGTSCAYWAPVEWLARAAAPLAAAGRPLHLSGPTPDLLAHPAWIPHLGRPVQVAWFSTWQMMRDHGKSLPGPGWWKPAVMKIADLPAQRHEQAEGFLDAATAQGLALGSWLQWSAPLEAGRSIVEEHRFFVLHGTPVTGSVYLRNDGKATTTWHHDMTSTHDQAALAAAADVTDRVGEHQPPAYVLDIALLADGSWVVVEANPAFSAGIYGCDPATALDVVVASNEPRHRNAKWRWRFDPHLTARAQQQRPLRIQVLGAGQ